ncbi:MAG: hypothetical protein ED557_08840 [Balneola sp.]|nr:MAG: hypothetical protein ED557_08840 [Balneola sp.]
MNIKRKVQIATFFALLFVWCSPGQNVFAQSGSAIRIVITDEGGDPLTGANVLLYVNGETELEAYCVTNVDGFCEFKRLRPGSYQLQISFLGFETHEQIITLEPSEIWVERIELNPVIGELGEVIVEEERGFTTGGLGITRVDAEDLSRVPSMSLDGDLMAYIRNVPGVVSIGDTGGDLYIRGGTPAQNIVLVDDLPIIKPFHISNLFSAFPEPVVSSIDVLAGGFDTRYMSSTSAVIDVNLKTGNMTRYSGSGSISPYISSLFIEGPIHEKKSSFFASGRVSTIKSFSGYLGTREQDMEFHDLMGRYSVHGDGFMCNATGLLTNDRGRISELTDKYLSWSNTGFGIRCFGFDESFVLPFEVSIGHTAFENEEVSDTGTNNSSIVRQTYMRLDFQDYWFGQKFDFGIQILSNTFQATVDERFLFAEQTSTKRLPMAQLHIKSEYDITKDIRIIPSLGTQGTFESRLTFEPRLRVITKPFGSSASEVSLAVGKYHQVIDGFSDQRDAGTAFTIYRSNSNLADLFSSIHRIVGWKQRLGSNFKTNVEGFYMTYEGLPVAKWTTLAQVSVTPALADAKSYGANARVEYETRSLYIQLGYAWSKVTYEARTDDLGAWLDQQVFSYSPPHDQRHQITSIFNATLGKLKFSTVWNLGSGKPYTKVFGFDLIPDVTLGTTDENPGVPRTFYSQPYNDRLPYYHRLDVSIQRSFTISKNMVFDTEIGCINTYDRSNVFYVDLNALERVDQTPILPYAAAKISFK